ncbi:MAG: beta-eliminating lyase-related protein [Micrococcales bacterium]|nr:beta-eliminating lyase-related protein [Micrococcales bacterium]
MAQAGYATDSIDLRSDTVTQPSPAMRQAMAQAKVDDDVIGRDPTMVELEQRAAELLGREAGLFMVSGSMSNAVALMVQVSRGDYFMAPRYAHILSHELGTASWLAGGIPVELGWGETPGVPKLAEIDAIAAEEDHGHAYFELVPRLLSLENTHNHAGGTIIPQALSDALMAKAHQAGWQVHLDGARLWHAAAAQSITPAEAAGAADSVTVCLSKGLGAPVGSLLCGSQELIDRARRARKMLGGGVRQGGVLAAAGLVALEQELPRIDQDRILARRLAQGLRVLGFDAPVPQTNIIMVKPGQASQLSASQLAASWNKIGVRCLTMGPAVRLVTHRDVDESMIDQALDRIEDCLKA